MIAAEALRRIGNDQAKKNACPQVEGMSERKM